MKKGQLDYILKVLLPLTLLVVVFVGSVTFYASKAERDNVGYMPEQPIPFSHALHAGLMKIDCRYCHIGVDKTRHATVPTAEICMNCHSLARKDTPNIQKLTKYFNDSISIPWKRIHKLPDYVYFNHSNHVNKGIQCVSCHGRVEEMEVVRQVKSFTMGKCLECHREAHEMIQSEIKDNKSVARIVSEKQGPEHCMACHR